MAKGYIGTTHSGNGSLDYYLREGECIGFKSSNGLNQEDTLKHWQQIERNEKLGNKELGIQGRHDARVRTNYTLAMPNELTPKQCIDRVERVLQQTGIKDCSYVIAVHRGEKEGVKNLHVHLLVNERNLQTMKKDRSQNARNFINKVLLPAYQTEFKKEFEQGKSVEKRSRISTALYKANEPLSRLMIQQYQVDSKKSLERPKNSLQSNLLAERLRGLGKSVQEQREQAAQKTEQAAQKKQNRGFQR